MAGGVAIAAAFATYLGPYGFSFRRDMMTVHWPQCLEERGVPLVLDASPPYPNARVFKTEGLVKTESTLSEKDKQQINDEPRGGSRDGTPGESRGGSRGGFETRDPVDGVLAENKPGGKVDGKMSDAGSINSEDAKDENSNYQDSRSNIPDNEEKQDVEQSEEEPTLKPRERKLSVTSQGKEIMNKTLIEYDAFSLAIAKLLLGDGPVRKLLTKGLGLRKIENAVLGSSSWQRVPLLIDPNTKSLEMIRMLEQGKQVLELDLGER
jgi:dynein heavy chain